MYRVVAAVDAAVETLDAAVETLAAAVETLDADVRQVDADADVGVVVMTAVELAVVFDMFATT